MLHLNMKYMMFLLLSILITACSSSDNTIDEEVSPPDLEPMFYKGMDLSFQSELENYNVTYRDTNGTPVDLLNFVTSKGTNLIRLKLWHTSHNGENTLSDVKAYATRIKNAGSSFLLDFHYSDFWADPGTQTPPAAWQNMTQEELRTAIYSYTKDVVTQLKNQNTLPEIIQIGNETDSGFLWNHGKVWDAFSNNWGNYAALVREAIRAVREVDTDGNVKIMLHHSNVEESTYFFNELAPFGIDFDIIGLSYYPQYQTKDLNLVANALNMLAITFGKDILLVEVAYPFTLQWDDNQTNYIGSLNQTIPEFSPTPEGQKAYLEWLISIIKNIPDHRGIGFCYWAPDWVTFPNNDISVSGGSAWENQCLFDFDHKVLPALDVFNNN
ncbi:glycoside hydrolase family 53 protein [Psychroserpens damuponensis]|uniref:glycoside hydrolase family 53 protein n=1 Tax=Psychroserpens damuponensis TaxID=943936 RepID=UPI000A015B08|nr:glycosyl hydrolase 53 family protein [Psychroserpens damuponensis]